MIEMKRQRKQIIWNNSKGELFSFFSADEYLHFLVGDQLVKTTPCYSIQTN